jgi:phosphosulfolactate synthase
MKEHNPMDFWLDLPFRTAKPRRSGLTMVIDNGLPTGQFVDSVVSNAGLIDVIKFGWGTAVVTADLQHKIDVLHDHDIRFSFGGTLFEKFVSQGRFEAYLRMCHHYGADLVEVSNGTIDLSNTEKASYIRRCAGEFPVVSEVGFKDDDRSEAFSGDLWVEAVAEDLEAGAEMVITEARESGRAGICDASGDLRFDVIEEILASGVDPDDLLFEAPTKALQAWFVTRIGANVNLGNVGPTDVIGVETLRLGLRSDTLGNYDVPGDHDGAGRELAGRESSLA